MIILTEPISTSAEDAEKALILRAFGPGFRLDHHADGAPYVDGTDKHISISHTREVCALAADDCPIGIDIEAPRRQLVRVAAKFIAPEENPEMTPEGLLPYWTAKEAVYKCARTPGLGLREIVVTGDTAAARGRRYMILRPHAGMAVATEITTS